MTPIVASYQASSVKKEDPEYEKIKKMLEMLGLSPTGSKEVDKSMLSMALQNIALQKMNQNSFGEKENIPFKDIMDALDIESVGDLEKDYTNTINELDDRIALASDDEEKQYYESLKTQVEDLYQTRNNDTAQASLFMGSTQLGELNKLMLM